MKKNGRKKEKQNKTHTHTTTHTHTHTTHHTHKEEEEERKKANNKGAVTSDIWTLTLSGPAAMRYDQTRPRCQPVWRLPPLGPLDHHTMRVIPFPQLVSIPYWSVGGGGEEASIRCQKKAKTQTRALAEGFKEPKELSVHKLKELK